MPKAPLDESDSRSSFGGGLRTGRRSCTTKPTGNSTHPSADGDGTHRGTSSRRPRLSPRRLSAVGSANSASLPIRRPHRGRPGPTKHDIRMRRGSRSSRRFSEYDLVPHPARGLMGLPSWVTEPRPSLDAYPNKASRVPIRPRVHGSLARSKKPLPRVKRGRSARPSDELLPSGETSSAALPTRGAGGHFERFRTTGKSAVRHDGGSCLLGRARSALRSSPMSRR